MSTMTSLSGPAVGHSAAPPRPAFVSDSLTMIGRSVRVVVRTPAAVLSATFMPVILLLVMTASFAKIVAPGAGYADYVNQVLPLFVIMGMAFGSVSTGVAAHRDLHSGMDARLRRLPIAPSAPLVGRIVGDAARNLGTLALMFAVGGVLGFRFQAGVLAALGCVVVALALGAGFAWLAVAVAIRASNAEGVVQLLNGLLLVLSFLSTGFVSLDDLPGWAQPIARANPFSAGVEAMRALSQGGPTTAPVLRSLAWSAVLVAVFSVIATRTYRRARA